MSTPARRPRGGTSPLGRLLAPIQAFLQIEAASGLLLIAATACAMVWVNLGDAGSYHHVWEQEIPLRIGSWDLTRPIHFWINDGLMTVFFLVVGLEIRREIHGGELSELRRATLPLAAALGGMLVPALIYAGLNHGRAGSAGWGIPMATDIAFAVGVLALLGSRVPAALRVLLLALAVIDDIGAILVIAIFYSAGVAPVGLIIAAAGMLAIVFQRQLGVRWALAYAPAVVAIWAGLYYAGIHPTLAGVIAGLMTPAEPAPDAEPDAAPPTEALLHRLHGIVAFGIMPLFALANAGVVLGGAELGGDATFVFLGIVLGLVIGKTAGITLAAFLSTRLGVAVRPRGASWAGIGLVGLAGGIGFTMAIFIAGLAFPPGPLFEVAKLAILVGSGAAAVLGLLFGLLVTRATPAGSVVVDEAAAERSTVE